MGECVVRKDLADAAFEADLESRFGGQGSGFCTQNKPFVKLPHDFAFGVPDVVINFGEIRDHIRSSATGGDDVMDSRLVRRVLAHQLGGVIHQSDRVERRSALLGSGGGVRGLSVKAKLHGHASQR